MKRSNEHVGEPETGWGLRGLLVTVDVISRLAAPVAIIAVSRDRAYSAMAAAATVATVVAVRALLVGVIFERDKRAIWDALVTATRAYSLSKLRVRPNAHGVGSLMEAAGSVARVRSSDLPRGLANLLCLVAIAIAVVVSLGWSWVVLGAVVVGLGAIVAGVMQRWTRTAQTQSFDAFSEGAHDFRVLVDAAPELRAHGREAQQAEAVVRRMSTMARAQRRMMGYAGLTGLFPVGIALLVLVPFASLTGIDFAQTQTLAEAGVLGGAGLMFSVGLARSIEAWTRTAAHRKALRDFLHAADQRDASLGSHVVCLRDARIELSQVSMRYAGATRETPSSVSLCWEPKQPGLAVTGDNGAGKSTLALCLIGLLQPTGGRLTFDGIAASKLDWATLRSKLVYVGQDAFVAGDRSVAWHLRLLATTPPSREDMTRALQRVGLLQVLERRATTGDDGPVDTPASQLSGGERKRMHLARALLGEPELIVLDEPEAGLDQDARAWLRELLGELAATSRVVVIAHDTSILPPDFIRLKCATDGSDGPLAHTANPRDTPKRDIAELRRATAS